LGLLSRTDKRGERTFPGKKTRRGGGGKEKGPDRKIGTGTYEGGGLHLTKESTKSRKPDQRLGAKELSIETVL